MVDVFDRFFPPVSPPSLENLGFMPMTPLGCGHWGFVCIA